MNLYDYLIGVRSIWFHATYRDLSFSVPDQYLSMSCDNTQLLSNTSSMFGFGSHPGLGCHKRTYKGREVEWCVCNEGKTSMHEREIYTIFYQKTFRFIPLYRIVEIRMFPDYIVPYCGHRRSLVDHH